jgi:hypothetical protein
VDVFNFQNVIRQQKNRGVVRCVAADVKLREYSRGLLEGQDRGQNQQEWQENPDPRIRRRSEWEQAAGRIFITMWCWFFPTQFIEKFNNSRERLLFIVVLG